MDAKVFDGPAIVNMIKPTDCKTFADYVSGVIQPFIEHHLRSAARLDLVFDRYFKDSLKSGTRSNRGSGVRRVVKANGTMPNNWSTFLRCDENKSELFPLIVDALSENISDTRGLFVGSREDGAVANQNVDLRSLMPCNIEEADERMFVHVQHAAALYPRILVKTVNSDVVVIALSAFTEYTVFGSSGSSLAWGSISNTFLFTRSRFLSDDRPPMLYFFFTHLVAVIPLLR